jgi:hypothetical protein
MATLYSLWYMPFAKSAKIELVNEGGQTFPEKQVPPLEFEITQAPLSRPAGQLGRFHAKWHRDAFLPTEPERRIDWPMLKTEGCGRFCGVALHIWNPRGGWWGEGDEKFFVDGEKFPSTFGTGSEDYFGYAWGDPNLFQKVYHDQTVCDSSGNTSLNRWHITDNVPFHRLFEGSIEKYFPNDRPCQYAAVAYFYLAPGQADAYRPVEPVSERTDYRTQLKTYKEPGVIEAEDMKLDSATGGMYHERLRMVEWGDVWSSGCCNWWERPRVGDKATLVLPVKESGKYEVKVQLCKSRDCAIVQMYLDGEKVGDPIDPFSPRMGATGPISLGAKDLSAGDHKLTIEVTGANEGTRKENQVRMDYVKLEKVE